MDDSHDYWRLIRLAAEDALAAVADAPADDFDDALSSAVHDLLADSPHWQTASHWHTNGNAALRVLTYTHHREAMFESTTLEDHETADAAIGALAYYAMHADIVEHACKLQGCE